jgi:hypothetical protein
MEVSTDSTVQTANMYNYLNPSSYSGDIGVNVSAFIIVAIVIVVFVAIFLSLGNGSQQLASSSTEYNKGTTMFGIGIIVLFIVVIFFSGLNYFFGSTISASLSQLFSSTPTIDISLNQLQSNNTNPSPNPSPKIPFFKKPQVFNVPGNYFGYEDAKSLCSAYGSRLATYDEMESAYNSGADWCSYGWSEGQMALFPTQKSTFSNLQKIKGHENDCGRPGINGGYMANPHLKFGVNCYGVKPKITQEEEELMAVTSPYPKTEKDILFDKKVEYYKKNLNNILVAPFNHDSWNRI